MYISYTLYLVHVHGNTIIRADKAIAYPGQPRGVRFAS